MSEKCPRCMLDYDNAACVPMLLCLQQHVCCLMCYQAQIKADMQSRSICPQCRQQIDKSKVVKFRFFAQYQQSLQKQKEKIRNQLEEKKTNFTKQKFLQLQKTFKLLFTTNISQRNYFNLTQKIQRLILEGKQQIALSMLKLLIQSTHHIQKLANLNIIGIGSKQEEIGFRENYCNLEWYRNLYHPQKLSAYDLLNFLMLKNNVQVGGWYLKMHQNNPFDYRLTFSIGLIFHNKEEIETAKEYFSKTISLNPTFSKSYLMLAIIFIQQEQPIESLQYARKCLERDKSNMYAQYLVANHYEDSINALTQFNKVCPQYPLALYKLADLHFKKCEYEEAVRRCEQCCVNASDKYISQCMFLKGKSLNSMKRYKQAAICFIEGLKTTEDNQKRQKLYQWTAGCYFKLLDYHEAIVWCKKIISSTKQAQWSRRLANAYYQLGMYKEVIAIYLELQSKQKNSVSLIKGIINCYKLLGDFYSKDQLQWIYKLQTIDSQSAETQYFIASSYFKNKKWEESIIWADKCIDRSFELENAYQIKYRSLSKLDRNEQALKIIVECIRKCETTIQQYQRIFIQAQKIVSLMKKSKNSSSNISFYQKDI